MSGPTAPRSFTPRHHPAHPAAIEQRTPTPARRTGQDAISGQRLDRGASASAESRKVAQAPQFRARAGAQAARPRVALQPPLSAVSPLTIAMKGQDLPGDFQNDALHAVQQSWRKAGITAAANRCMLCRVASPPLISTYLTPTACSACSPAMISRGWPKRTLASVAPALSA